MVKLWRKTNGPKSHWTVPLMHHLEKMFLIKSLLNNTMPLLIGLKLKGQLVKSLKWMCFLAGVIRCGGKCTEKSSIGDSVLFDPSNGGHLMKRCCCALFDPAECLTPEYEVR